MRKLRVLYVTPSSTCHRRRGGDEGSASGRSTYARRHVAPRPQASTRRALQLPNHCVHIGPSISIPLCCRAASERSADTARRRLHAERPRCGSGMPSLPTEASELCQCRRLGTRRSPVLSLAAVKGDNPSHTGVGERAADPPSVNLRHVEEERFDRNGRRGRRAALGR